MRFFPFYKARSIRRHALLMAAAWLLIGLFAAPSLSAQEDDESSDSLQNELSRPWRVAVLPLYRVGASDSGSIALLRSLPEVIASGLSELDVRVLTSGELESYRKYLEETFDEEEDLSLPADVRSLEFTHPDVADSVLLSLFHRQLAAYLESGQGLDSDLLNAIADDADADLIVSGTLQVRDRYAFIDLLLISARHVQQADAVLGHQIFALRSLEAVSELRSRVLDEFGPWLYNGPYGSIHISWPEEESLRLYLDETYRGNEPTSLSLVPQGDHLLELYRGESLVYSRDFFLAHGDVLELSYESESLPPRFLFVNTVPNGIELYSGSSFLGLTPLGIPSPAQDEYLQLNIEGFSPMYVPVQGGDEGYLNVRIPHSAVNWREQAHNDRRSFYSSLGVTVVSALVPLIASGINRNLSLTDMDSLDDDEETRLLNQIKVARSVSYLGTGVFVLSIFDTIDKLSRYLESSEAARGVLEYSRE